MSIHFPKWTIALAAALVSSHSLAETVAVDPSYVVSINLSTLETSGDYGLSTDEASGHSALDYASSTGYSLGWGIEDQSGRFMLEYYYSAVDIQSPPFEIASDRSRLKTHSLFYSGYWVPNIVWGVKGILGAGIGYSEQTLENAQLGKLRDRSLSVKASVGLEYAVVNRLSIYALAEGLFYGDVKDEAGGADRMLSDNEQLSYALGVNFRY